MRKKALYRMPKNRSVYPDDWPSIALSVKVAANWTCQYCGAIHDIKNHRTISSVHHIDHNRANCNRSNLIVVCKECHIRIHAKYRRADPRQLRLGIVEPSPWEC